MRTTYSSTARSTKHQPRRAETDARLARPTRRYSVLNDFRYLTADDVELLRAATGEAADREDPKSQFAQQLALDRRRGDLERDAPVTATYLRDASVRIERENAGRVAFRNPYAGKAYE
ncbi:hypothetical protein GZ195_02700, partial [Dermatophilus congolensis]